MNEVIAEVYEESFLENCRRQVQGAVFKTRMYEGKFPNVQLAVLKFKQDFIDKYSYAGPVEMKNDGRMILQLPLMIKSINSKDFEKATEGHLRHWKAGECFLWNVRYILKIDKNSSGGKE